ncbi:MAG: GerMN domain-containing protein [Sphaerochaetaceae bacterium]|nr:GerMN domain-containing protein [Sphaerochaetaceae bacterium]
MNLFGNTPKGLVYLILSLIVVILLILSVLLSLPRIRTSIEHSGVVSVLEEHLSDTSRSQEPLYTLLYPIMSSTEDTYRYTSATIPLETVVSPYHTLLEGLMIALPPGPLLQGAVSFIPEGTRLEGFTRRKDIAYIALSPEFLDESEFEQCSYARRADQVQRNLEENFGITKVVFIVRGIIVDTSQTDVCLIEDVEN